MAAGSDFSLKKESNGKKRREPFERKNFLAHEKGEILSGGTGREFHYT